MCGLMSDSNRLISIVLPCHNGEQFLSEAIESIIKQTYENWELIFVDDCSTDNSLSIAEAYASENARITIIRNKANQKLPASLNIGFRHAKGDYLTWTSDDNIFEERALEEMAKALDDNPNVSLVYCGMKTINEEGAITSSQTSPPPANKIYMYNPIGACFMYRKCVDEKLGGYDEDLFLVEDYDFWLRAYRFFEFKAINDNPYRYRRHGGSLTSTKKHDIAVKLLDLYRRELREAHPPLLHRTELVFHALWLKINLFLKRY